jgi:hypothetical protein
LKKHIFILSLVASVISAAAYAANWISVDTLEGSLATFSVDLSSLQKADNFAYSVVKAVMKSGTVVFERSDNCKTGDITLKRKHLYNALGQLVENDGETIHLTAPATDPDQKLHHYICSAVGFSSPETEPATKSAVTPYSEKLKVLYPACADQTGQEFALCIANEKEQAAEWERRKELQAKQAETAARDRKYLQEMRKARINAALQNYANSTRTTHCSGYGYSINCTSY